MSVHPDELRILYGAVKQSPPSQLGDECRVCILCGRPVVSVGYWLPSKSICDTHGINPEAVCKYGLCQRHDAIDMDQKSRNKNFRRVEDVILKDMSAKNN